MLSYKTKLTVSTIIAILFISILGMIYTVNGANENIQIIKKSGNEYLIYISEHMDSQFEFAFSKDQGADKETLGYKSSILDSTSEKNDVAYIDNSLYTTYFSGKTYFWARDLSGKYFAEKVEVDLSKAIEESNVNLINNLTKIIKVDTKNTITTSEVVNEVKVTKTVGKVDVLEEGTTYYQLVKLPASEEYNEFMKTAEKIACSRVAEGLSLCIFSGLDMDQSMEMTEKLIRHSGMKEKMVKCRKLMMDGTEFDQALAQSQIFSGIYGKMISVGIRTGAMDQVMKKITDEYKSEIEDTIQHKVAIVEPTLVAVLSFIVGLILISVMLPLMSIMSNLS